MKRLSAILLSICLLAALPLPSGAQALPDTLQSSTRSSIQERIGGLFGRRTPSKKQVLEENELLKGSLDSLQMLVDSLRERKYLDEYEIAVLEGNNEEEEEEIERLEYTTEVSDSLLHL